jgi:acetamidase/formamidase
MSGGNGGGGGGGGFVPPKRTRSTSGEVGGEGRCDINVQVPLSATNPANIKKAKTGDILNVEIRKFKGTDAVVAVIPSDNSVVGAIAYRQVDELIDCINEGFEYKAKITSLSATSVKVQVTPK